MSGWLAGLLVSSLVGAAAELPLFDAPDDTSRAISPVGTPATGTAPADRGVPTMAIITPAMQVTRTRTGRTPPTARRWEPPNRCLLCLEGWVAECLLTADSTSPCQPGRLEHTQPHIWVTHSYAALEAMVACSSHRATAAPRTQVEPSTGRAGRTNLGSHAQPWAAPANLGTAYTGYPPNEPG